MKTEPKYISKRSFNIIIRLNPGNTENVQHRYIDQYNIPYDMIITLNAKKTFNKTQHHIMTKFLERLLIQGEYVNMKIHFTIS